MSPDREVDVQNRTRSLVAMNEALIAEMQERQASDQLQVDLLRQLVKAQEDEQRRISRELHDQLGQQVTAIQLKLSFLKSRRSSATLPEMDIDDVIALVKQLDDDIEFLVWQMRPTVLEDLGLAEALSEYTNSWSTHTRVAAQIILNGTP